MKSHSLITHTLKQFSAFLRIMFHFNSTYVVNSHFLPNSFDFINFEENCTEINKFFTLNHDKRRKLSTTDFTFDSNGEITIHWNFVHETSLVPTIIHYYEHPLWPLDSHYNLAFVSKMSWNCLANTFWKKNTFLSTFSVLELVHKTSIFYHFATLCTVGSLN